MTILVIGLLIAAFGQTADGEMATATLDRTETILGESVTLTVDVTGDGAADSEVSRPPRGEGLVVERVGSRTFSAGKRPLLITRYFYRLYPLRTGTLTIAPVEVSLRSRRKASSAPCRLVVVDGPGPDWIDAAVTVEGDRFYRQQITDFNLRITVPGGARRALRLWLPWIDAPGLDRVDGEAPRGSGDLAVRLIQSNREEPFTFLSASASSVGCNDYSTSIAFLLAETGDFAFERGILAIDDARSGVPVRYCLFDSPSLTVVDLPSEGRPASFTNGVGLFEVAFEAEPRTVRVGDSLDLCFAISGRAGSLDSFDFPEFPFLTGSFRLFAKRDSAERLDDGRIVKKRRFELSPLSTAVDRVPPLEFSYFDPEAGEYTTLLWEGAEIDVLPGKGGGPPADGTRRAVDDIETIYEDYPNGWTSILGPLDIVLFVAALGALGTWVFCFRGWFRSDPAERRRRTASRQFGDEMAALRGAASAVIVAPLFADYLAHRFGLRREETMAGDVERMLVEKGMSTTLAGRVERFFHALDARRYGAGADEPLSRERIDEVLGLVESLEGEAGR